MTPRAVEWKLLLIIGKKPDYDDDRVPCNYDQQILEPFPPFSALILPSYFSSYFEKNFIFYGCCRELLKLP